MPLNARYLRELSFATTESIVSDHDAMLYALSIGLGRDPLDESELCYVYERNLIAFPTLPLVTCQSQAWISDPRTGITWSKVVHGAERLSIHRAIPIGARIRSDTRVAEIIDKGARGAILVLERSIRGAERGDPIATSESTVVCRADGGFGGSSVSTRQFTAVPTRDPDHVASVSIEANAALLYRLNQDRNPLHADPEVARKAGFPQPILHGLATFGFAAVAAFRRWPSRALAGIEARFASPVYPAETLAVDLWEEDLEVAFRVRVPRRAMTVLDGGRLRYV
jgi:acyl dehydratase